MWRILQQQEPDDFVLATGETNTVRTFCEMAFKHAGIELTWEGEGINEKGRDFKTGNVLVEVDPKYFRPTEVEMLIGDAAKAKDILDWEPKYDLDALVKDMVESDLQELESLSLAEKVHTHE